MMSLSTRSRIFRQLVASLGDMAGQPAVRRTSQRNLVHTPTSPRVVVVSSISCPLLIFIRVKNNRFATAHDRVVTGKLTPPPSGTCQNLPVRDTSSASGGCDAKWYVHWQGSREISMERRSQGGSVVDVTVDTAGIRSGSLLTDRHDPKACLISSEIMNRVAELRREMSRLRERWRRSIAERLRLGWYRKTDGSRQEYVAREWCDCQSMDSPGQWLRGRSSSPWDAQTDPIPVEEVAGLKHG